MLYQVVQHLHLSSVVTKLVLKVALASCLLQSGLAFGAVQKREETDNSKAVACRLAFSALGAAALFGTAVALGVVQLNTQTPEAFTQAPPPQIEHDARPVKLAVLEAVKEYFSSNKLPINSEISEDQIHVYSDREWTEINQKKFPNVRGGQSAGYFEPRSSPPYIAVRFSGFFPLQLEATASTLQHEVIHSLSYGTAEQKRVGISGLSNRGKFVGLNEAFTEMVNADIQVSNWPHSKEFKKYRPYYWHYEAQQMLLDRIIKDLSEKEGKTYNEVFSEFRAYYLTNGEAFEDRITAAYGQGISKRLARISGRSPYKEIKDLSEAMHLHILPEHQLQLYLLEGRPKDPN